MTAKKSPHSVQFKRPYPSFYAELDAMYASVYGGQFFDDLDAIRDANLREQQRLERYRARREANEKKAHRVLLRLRRVQAIDLFKLTQHIVPDFFGSKQIQFDRVKEIYEKKARIVWHLSGLYRYLAFDVEDRGWAAIRGFHYSRHRKRWFKLLEEHREKVRQQKWDLKRAKVRQRRKMTLQESAYELRRGMGVNVPVPVEIPIWD